MRIRRILVALLCANGLLLLGALLQGRTAVAQAVPPILRARAIELVDDRGVARAQLDVEPSGEVVFRLRDASGTIRVKIGASEDGSGLVLLDDATEPGIHALAKRAGTSVTVARGKQRHIIKP
jgi:hypothetical protein